MVEEFKFKLETIIGIQKPQEKFEKLLKTNLIPDYQNKDQMWETGKCLF